MHPRRAVVFMLGLGLLTACAVSGGRGIGVPLPAGAFGVPKTTDYSVPERQGKLTHEEAMRIAPRIRALRADPAQLQQSVGDTIRLSDDVRILALDSAGVVLGELPAYSFSFPVQSLRLLPDGRFVCARAGKVRFTAQLPKIEGAARGSKRPSTFVMIDVVPVAP